MNVEEFVNVFNEYYPFERYIVKTPKSIVYLFDDAQLTELFMPSTEIKPIVLDGQFIGFTKFPKNEIYVKVKGSAGEMRFALFDFADSVIDDIMCIVISDFGGYEWESLYVEHDDGSEDLKIALLEQKRLIEEKYGECNVKDTINAELL
jgi:hypothetical protein